MRKMLTVVTGLLCFVAQGAHSQDQDQDFEGQINRAISGAAREARQAMAASTESGEHCAKIIEEYEKMRSTYFTINRVLRDSAYGKAFREENPDLKITAEDVKLLEDRLNKIRKSGCVTTPPVVFMPAGIPQNEKAAAPDQHRPRRARGGTRRRAGAG